MIVVLRRVLLQVLLLALASNADAADALRLGTNLGSISDWSTQRPFTDLFKQSRPWQTQCDDARDPDCGGRWETGEGGGSDLKTTV